MMSREADLYERAHSAEQDLRASREFAFAASWERMVLLASALEYRPFYGTALPAPERDHDIITLEAMLACAYQHHPKGKGAPEHNPSTAQREDGSAQEG